jgi:phosphoribosylamine--glycine ligase
MGFKLISKNGDFLPLLSRIEDEGNEVVFHTTQGGDIYKGILPSVDSPIELDIQKDDTVIFDMVGAGDTAEVLKDKNYHVIGGGKLNDKIELDRNHGNEFMEKHGIPVPPTHKFDSFDEVKKFLLEHTGERFVFKPDGNLETDLTIVPSSWEGLIRSLPYIEEKVPKDTMFQLQEFVEGIEMSTEAWFNGTKFLQPINSTMEEKKFMDSDLGPNTGCAGNIVWAWEREYSEFLYEYIFRPLEDTLRKADYIGPLDINGIWNEDGIHGLEWTSRFGYDAIQAMTRLFTIPFGKFLENIRTIDKMPLSNELAMSIRVSIPPYPSEGDVPKVPIVFPEDFSKEEQGMVYLSDVFVSPDTGLSCAGTDGYILAIATSGKSIPKMKSLIYNVADRIEVPNKQYRSDIGDRVIGEKAKMEMLLKNLMKKA